MILIKIYNPFAYVIFYMIIYLVSWYSLNTGMSPRNQTYFVIHINLLLQYNDKYMQYNKLLYKSNLKSNIHKKNID